MICNCIFLFGILSCDFKQAVYTLHRLPRNRPAKPSCTVARGVARRGPWPTASRPGGMQDLVGLVMFNPLPTEVEQKALYIGRQRVVSCMHHQMP